MNISPTNSPAPKYPALAALAVAALTLPACQQQQIPPQPTAGAPLPPPAMLGGSVPVKSAPKEAQRTPGRFATPPVKQKPQIVPGRAKVER